MELIELGVSQLSAGAEGHGDAIAGGYGGVGGMEVELARSAAGEDNGVSVECTGKTFGVNDFQASCDAVLENEIEGEGVFEDADVRGANGADQGCFDGKAGGVTSGMEDTCFRMSSLQAAGEVAGGGLIEGDPEADEVANAGRAFGA